MGYQSHHPFWRSPNSCMTILWGFHGFQDNNLCGCAATRISIPGLHGDSTLKDLASTLSFKHWGGPPGLSSAKILFPLGARRTPGVVSSPGVLQTHPQPKKKAKISLEKSFLLASHTQSSSWSRKSRMPLPRLPTILPLLLLLLLGVSAFSTGCSSSIKAT